MGLARDKYVGPNGWKTLFATHDSRTLVTSATTGFLFLILFVISTLRFLRLLVRRL